jgi:hypothetical protein
MTVPFVDVCDSAYDPQSKFQVLTEPLQQLPHKCVGCQRYSRNNEQEQPLQFIDFNAEVEFFGKIFICTSCVTEMAGQLGFMAPEHVKELIEKKSQLIRDVSALLNDREELTNALAGFRRVFGNPDVTISPSVYSVEAASGEDVEPDVPTESNLESTGGEERLTEPDDEQGSTDLSDDADLAEFL